jgi:2,4-dienoyl-CoA reductase-like NADH-dependent reductase (Old Yellow Enzyme family)
MKNRFILAPQTTTQSNPDGTLGDADFNYLAMRAKGGFGMVLTCAAHVQEDGQAWPGQLGVWSDKHVEGLSRLARAIQKEGSLAIVQLHHGGIKADEQITGRAPLSPSDDPESGAREISVSEIHELVKSFGDAARRVQQAGFDGVEIHAAHSYLPCRFFSPKFNRRTDEYGGSLFNRARVLFEILKSVRQSCRPDFIVGVRVSVERFGLLISEMRQIAEWLVRIDNRVDFIDYSLWDCFKKPEDAELAHTSLIRHFMEIDRGEVRFIVAGLIMDPDVAVECLNAGADGVALARASILHHDYPNLLLGNPAFRPVRRPVSDEWLTQQGLSMGFVKYLKSLWLWNT